MRVDQVLVAQQVRHHRRHRHEVPAGHGNEGLDGLHARGDRLDQRQEREVEEEDGVLRVIGDPHDLVRMQPGIERVQHGAGARHGVVQLHVAVAIPCERRDTIAKADAVRGQRVGHAARALGEVAVSLAMQVAFDAARDDLLIAMVTLRMSEERRDQQRLLHHHSVHGCSSYQPAARGCWLSGKRESSRNCMGVLCMKIEAVREMCCSARGLRRYPNGICTHHSGMHQVSAPFTGDTMSERGTRRYSRVPHEIQLS